MDLGGLIHSFGLPGLFGFALVDGDSSAFLAGAFAHRHLLHYESATLVVAAAGVTLDTALWRIGRSSSRLPVVARLLDSPRARTFADRVRSRPLRSVVTARFLYGLHGPATMLLGAGGVPWRVFAPLNLAATLVWAHLWSALGYLAGQAIERLFGRLALHLHLAAVVALVVAAGLVLLWLRRRHRPPA